MFIGYARFSISGLDMTEQRLVLETAGCSRTYYERQQDPRRTRPELNRMLEQLSFGDVVVVCELNRLARSTSELFDLIERITASGACLRSVSEPWIDTTQIDAHLLLTVATGIIEFERAREKQRLNAGRDAAHARGVTFGRPSKITADQLDLAKRLLDEGMSCRDAAKHLSCHNATLYRALKRSAQS